MANKETAQTPEGRARAAAHHNMLRALRQLPPGDKISISQSADGDHIAFVERGDKSTKPDRVVTLSAPKRDRSR